jgi:tRNA(Arg) A34 adenosine deaminase TadA
LFEDDPAASGGVAIKLNHHASIEGGVMGEECSKMLSNFFSMRREQQRGE